MTPYNRMAGIPGHTFELAAEMYHANKKQSDLIHLDTVYNWGITSFH